MMAMDLEIGGVSIFLAFAAGLLSCFRHACCRWCLRISVI